MTENNDSGPGEPKKKSFSTEFMEAYDKAVMDLAKPYQNKPDEPKKNTFVKEFMEAYEEAQMNLAKPYQKKKTEKEPESES